MMERAVDVMMTSEVGDDQATQTLEVLNAVTLVAYFIADNRQKRTTCYPVVFWLVEL